MNTVLLTNQNIKRFFLILKNSIITLFLIVITFSNTVAQKTFPVIEKYGGVFEIPEAEIFVDLNKEYKIVVDITDGEKNQTQDINKSFELLARLYNLYALSGVKKENLNIVAVIHFTATPVILSDEAFNLEFGTNNPNTEVINTLANAGVKFYICGQSLRARKFVNHKRNSNIRVAHGAILALSHFQNLGYALLKF
jgi:intracellular sulfur oxidation DsrE/DsrF family protein